MKRFTWWRMEQKAPHNARERWWASSSILHHVKRFMSHLPNVLEIPSKYEIQDPLLQTAENCRVLLILTSSTIDKKLENFEFIFEFKIAINFEFNFEIFVNFEFNFEIFCKFRVYFRDFC